MPFEGRIEKEIAHSRKNAGYGTRQRINFISPCRRISFRLELFLYIHFRSVAAIRCRCLQEYPDIFLLPFFRNQEFHLIAN